MELNRRDFVKGVVGTGVLLASGAGLSACAPKGGTDTGKNSSINGVFEGSGTGMQGKINVSLEVTNGEITKVNVLDNKETPRVAKVALERIPAQIVEHQSLGLDTVTGATLASMGIITAAADAAKKAKLDVSALKANKVVATPGKDETWETDVLVIGGGGAAFSAAITAAQEGAKVIMIEKGSVVGGNTMMAGPAFNAVDKEAQDARILSAAQKKILDSYLALPDNDPSLKFDLFPEWKDILPQLKEDIKAFYATHEGKTAGVDMPGFDSNTLHMWHTYIGGLREMNDGSWIASERDLVHDLVEKALDSFKWMDTIGLQTIYGKNAAESLYTVLGAMWPRTHNLASYDARVNALRSTAEKEGIEIHTETPGKELIVNGGKVEGAHAQKIDGTKITIKTTKGVILACGGYSANAPMVKQFDKYWGEDLSDNTLTTNLGTNKGDGIWMGKNAGAALTGMEIAQMMPSSSPTKGTMTDGAQADAAKQIWIDNKGNRFVDEYAERDVLVKAAFTLEDKTFFIIYSGRPDGDTCNGVSLDDITNFGDRVGDLVEDGHIWYGETLAELAEATKRPADNVTPSFTEEALRNVIEKYNTYFKNQKDEDFGKKVISGYVDLDYIESTPGVGICITPRRPSLHHTMGGVVIDTHTRVLNEKGEIIPGLYAAGEVTGGIHAGNRLGGNAIADIFTYGRIAGLNIVASA